MRKSVSFVDVQPPCKSLSGATDGMQQTHTIQSFVLRKGVPKQRHCSLLRTGHNDSGLVSAFWCVSGYKPRSLMLFLCLFKGQATAKKRCLSAAVACRAARAAWGVGACDPSWRSVAFYTCHTGRNRVALVKQMSHTRFCIFSSARCRHGIPRRWKVFRMIHDFAIAHLVTF